MGDLYFFDLPVYRLAYSVYNADRERDFSAQIADMGRGIANYEVPQDTKVWMGQHQYEKYGPWRFNEIIGYIRLHFCGSQIRGEYFSAEKKRNALSRYKVFTYRTHKLAAEINLHPAEHKTNEQVLDGIKRYIYDCKKELAKGRVIDDSVFLAIAPHVDWYGLLGWRKQQ